MFVQTITTDQGRKNKMSVVLFDATEDAKQFAFSYVLY